MNTEVENVVDKGRHTSLYLASLDSWLPRRTLKWRMSSIKVDTHRYI